MKREFASWIGLSAVFILTACKFDSPTAPVDTPDGLTVGFATPTTLVDELSGTVEIPVQLSAAGTATVEYRVTGGNATSGTDFTLVDGTLTFGGSTSEVLDLSISSDGLEEPNETIEITLSNPTGAALGQASHVVTISADILPRVRFMVGTSSGSEGTPATLDVQLDLPPKAPVSITLALSGSAVGGGTDYGLANDTVVTFDVNEMTKQVPLAVNTDDLDEDDEDVIAALTIPNGVVIDTTSSTTTHTILDDDLPPTVGFEAKSVDHPEGKPDATQNVVLSGPSGKMITVEYRQTSGAASAGDVTVGGTGTLTFLPGETSKPVPLTVTDDLFDETDPEDAVITLENPVNTTIPTPDFTLNILDDDDPPSIHFAAPTTTVTEGTTTITVTVQLTAESGLPITVGFARGAASTAVAGGDFTFVTASPLSFPPGTTSQDITITIANDLVGEIDESLIIDLANPTNASLAGQIVHTVTISDNDCLGTGAFEVCPAIAPTTGTVVLTSAAFNTNTNPNCQATQPAGWAAQGQDPVCIVAAENITIPAAGLILLANNGRPLILYATGTITVSGVLDASAITTTNGHTNGSASCTAFPTAPDSNNAGGGGGAGASFMSKGGDGADGDNGSSNSDGGTAPTADATDPVKLRGGCKGQNGGNGNTNGTRGVGGGGGGAVYLIAGTITTSAGIDVSGGGGSGGATQNAGGGGGGAGGMILLDATTVNVNGALIANGGGAGQGADNNTNGGVGGEPSLGQPTTPAPGGSTGSAGGNGGNGMVTGTQATNGTQGGSNTGGGAGGGGGGFIKSSGTIGGTVSAGKIVQP